MKKCTHSIKSVLIPLELTAGLSAANAAIQKGFFWIGKGYTSNIKERGERYHKMIKSLEESSLLITVFSKTIEKEVVFLSMLLGTLYSFYYKK